MSSFFLIKGEPFSYTMLEKEDPEEVKHRKAQFLIYKTLEAANCPRRRPCMALRLCRRVKLKACTRLSRLRKAVQLTFCGVRRRLKAVQRVLYLESSAPSVSLPPLFRLEGPHVQ